VSVAQPLLYFYLLIYFLIGEERMAYIKKSCLILIALSLSLFIFSCGTPTNDGVIPKSSNDHPDIVVSKEWTTEAIRSRGNSGTHSNLSILPTGNHILFFDTSTTSQIIYGYKGTLETDLWQYTTIATFGGTSQFLSLLRNDMSQIELAFYNGHNLQFARKASSSPTFQVTTIDANRGAGTNASLTKVDGTLAVAYQRCFLDCNELFEINSKSLWVSTSSNGTSWQAEPVEDIPASQPLTSRGHGAQAFMNETGNLSVVAYNGETTTLEIFDHKGSFGVLTNWQKTEVEKVGTSIHDISVAIDPTTGLTAIAYFDDSKRELKVAFRKGTGQTFTIQTAIATGDVGSGNSIAIRSSDGAIGVSCYDSYAEGPRFALRGSDGVWKESELVEAGNNSGESTSLVFDGDIPRFTHYQRLNGDLMISSRKEAP
jgi:hypothetical protein